MTPRFGGTWYAFMSERLVPLRLTLISPPRGVMFSLQHGDRDIVSPVMSTGEDLSLDLEVRLTDDGRFLGPYVRREGPRRFVYFRAGQSAGQHGTQIDRRGKVWIDEIPAALLATGKRLEGRMTGAAKDGGPACASIKGVVWRALD